jgi:L-ornithine N5-oxygenase
MYTQRLRDKNESNWQHRIMPNTTVSTIEDCPDQGRVRLHLNPQENGHSNGGTSSKISMDIDAVLIATGYVRDAHKDLLTSMAHLITKEESSRSKVPVSRDYRVKLDSQKVDLDAGIWLQGCNESTHGVSQLLSPLRQRLTSPF